MYFHIYAFSAPDPKVTLLLLLLKKGSNTTVIYDLACATKSVLR